MSDEAKKPAEKNGFDSEEDDEVEVDDPNDEDFVDKPDSSEDEGSDQDVYNSK